MPMYGPSVNQTLKDATENSKEKLVERSFFLTQYRKRGFISDINVLYDDDAGPLDQDTEKTIVLLFNSTAMGHKDIKKLFDSTVSYIARALQGEMIFYLIQMDIGKDNIVHEIERKCTSIIENLQFLVAIEWGLFQKEAQEFTENKDLCKKLLADKNIKKMITPLTCISIRYGLYVTDLCRSSDFNIEIKDRVDEEDLEYRLFPSRDDLYPDTNPHIYTAEKNPLQMKRFVKSIKNSREGKELKRLEAVAYKNSLKGISSEKFHSNSVLQRRAGLWLWDRCENPIKGLYMKKLEAFKELSEHEIFEGREKTSLYRSFHRAYNVTKKSIRKGKVMPMEDKKRSKDS